MAEKRPEKFSGNNIEKGVWMSDLKNKIIEVIEKIKELKGKKITETETKKHLIEPLFKSIGWDIDNINLVRMEYTQSDISEHLDYACGKEITNDKVDLVIEAKSLNTSIDDIKWQNQVVTNAYKVGSHWCILTNGCSFMIYNTMAKSKDDRLFEKIELDKVDEKDERKINEIKKILELLSPENILNGSLNNAYNKKKRNENIENAIKEIILRPPEYLTSQIRKKLKEKGYEIEKKIIEGYLKNIRISFEIGGLPPPPPLFPPQWPSIKKDLLNKGLVSIGQKLKANYKGKEYFASITDEGNIEYNGQIYNSPSLAAKAASGGKSCDGWKFWKYEDKIVGKFEPIDKLRKEFSKTK